MSTTKTAASVNLRETASLAHGDPSDWRWQLRRRITDLDGLVSAGILDQSEAERLRPFAEQLHIAITPYLLSLIPKGEPADPILRQFVPSPQEFQPSTSSSKPDPLDEEDDSPVPGLVHRHPDRVLMVVTSACAAYCRHCVRRRKWCRSERAASTGRIQAMLDYIRTREEVRDVIVSGGDPLTLSSNKLEGLLRGLREIPHVEIIRIGTRVPVVLPQRIDEGLLTVLGRYGPIWVNTQFNHPREITEEAAAACDRLLRAGMPVNNQSVLLRGVNDSVETMRALCQGLLRIKVRPYYLFQSDPVTGTDHFRTSVWKGIEIIEGLEGHTSGLAVPTFAVDAPGGGGKIPLMPNYLLSASERSLALRNYEGVLLRYENPAPAEEHADGPPEAPVAGSGVASLLSGKAETIVPEHSRRHARRRARSEDRDHVRPEGDAGCGGGCTG